MILDPFITLTAQYCLALLMFAGGMHKSADVGRFAVAISAYRIVPACLERPVAMLLITIEVVLGASLVVPRAKEHAALVTACLLALYFVAIAVNILGGRRQLNCACSFHGRATPVSGFHLLRNAILILLAVVGSMPHSSRIVCWVDGVQITASVLCLALIYLSADSLLANSGDIASLEV
jgi:hypothetical protein